jgi:hypothetical protein
MTCIHKDARRFAARVSCAVALAALTALPVASQVRVDNDRHTRLQRFGRDMGYGVAEGLAFAGIDQALNEPSQWGNGANGYAKRAASDVGEFVIQESVTEGLAAALNRPLDYTRCSCRNAGSRFGHALLLSVVDQMPDGSKTFAVPRVTGAFVGSFAQATWRPGPSSDRTRVALGNAATSLAIGAGINLFHEFVK